MPAPAARERRGPTKGDKRRQLILDALESRLRERAISELSVEEIAGAAGISRSAFYFYFDSKYAALGAALKDAWDEMAQGAAPFFEGHEAPPRSYVRQVLADVAAAWQKHEHLLAAMIEAGGADSGARALWDEWLEAFAALIAERIEAERAAGRAPAGPPGARELADVLLGMNERAYYSLTCRGASKAMAERTVEALARVWLAAVWGERVEPKETR